MTVMTISEARAALPEVVSRAAEGEEITITRHGSPVAVVVRPDIMWAPAGPAALQDLDDVHVAALLRERARQRGLTLEEALQMILDAAGAPAQAPSPIRLHTVRTSGASTWSREEIYDDDAR